MNDESAFLSAILANPDDDTVRLVYADWLDEHDDPRGEFLRTAVLLRTNPQANERKRRLLELRPSISSRWLVQALRTYAEDDVREVVLRSRVFGGDSEIRALLSVDGGDPSWYLFTRLSADYPGVRSLSEIKRRDDFQGTRCSMNRIQWKSHECCVAEHSVIDGSRSGYAYRYQVELRDEVWNVMGGQLPWYS